MEEDADVNRKEEGEEDKEEEWATLVVGEDVEREEVPVV